MTEDEWENFEIRFRQASEKTEVEKKHYQELILSAFSEINNLRSRVKLLEADMEKAKGYIDDILDGQKHD